MDGIAAMAMPAEADEAMVVRDRGGRFAPGWSGNPSGKKPGTRNRATVLREMLEDGEVEGLGRQVIDRALAGDKVAGRVCFERLFPKPRSRAIELDLPEGASAADDLAVFDAAFAEMAAGGITLDEMQSIARLLMIRRKLRESVARDATAAAASDPADAAESRAAAPARPSAPQRPASPPAGRAAPRVEHRPGGTDRLHPACISPTAPPPAAASLRGAA